MKRRFLSGLLAVCLVLSLGMTCAFSDGTEEPVPEEAGQTAEYPPVADGGGQADLPALSQAAPETGDGQAPAEPVPEEVTAPQAETVPQEEAAPLDETVAQDEAAPLDAEAEEAEDPGVMLTSLKVNEDISVNDATNPGGLKDTEPTALTATLNSFATSFTIKAEFTGTAKYSTASASAAKTTGTPLQTGASTEAITANGSAAGEEDTVVYIYLTDDDVEVYYKLTVKNKQQETTAQPTFSETTVIATEVNTKAEFTLQSPSTYIGSPSVKATNTSGNVEATGKYSEGKITLTFDAITATQKYTITVTENNKAESLASAEVTVQPRTPDPKVNDKDTATVTALAGNKTAEVTLSNAASYDSYAATARVENTGGGGVEATGTYTSGGKLTLNLNSAITTTQNYDIYMTNQTDWAKSTRTLTVTVDPGPTLNSLTVDSQSVSSLGTPTNNQSNPTTLDTVTLTERKDSFTLTADFDGTAWYSTKNAADAKTSGTPLEDNSPSDAISFPAKDLGEELSQPVYICVTKNGADIYYKLTVTSPAGPALTELKLDADNTITLPDGDPSTSSGDPTALSGQLTHHEDTFQLTATFNEGTTAKYSTKGFADAESGSNTLSSGNAATITDEGGKEKITVYLVLTKSGVSIYYELTITDPVGPKLNSLTVNGKTVEGDLTQHGTVGEPQDLTVELGPLDETFTLTAGFEAEWAKYSLADAETAATGTALTNGSSSGAIPITEAKTVIYLCLNNHGMNIYYELTVTRPEVKVDVPSEPTGTGMSGVADKEQTEQQLLTMTDDIVSAVQAGKVPAGIDRDTADAIEQAIQDGHTITTDLTVERSHGVSAAEFKARLADGETIDQYLDITIVVMVDSVKAGDITETAKPLQFAVVLSDEVLAKGVRFYVLRQHDGDIEKLPAQVSGNTLTFSSDKFSEYGVVYTSSVADAAVAPIPDQTYTGSAITPAPHVTTQAGVELKAGEDYTVTYKNNVQVGTATAVITGTGGFTGTLEVTFRILQPAAGGNSDKTVPNTGDGSPLLLWLTLLSVQAAALALIPFARKRKAACRTASGAGDRHGRK